MLKFSAQVIYLNFPNNDHSSKQRMNRMINNALIIFNYIEIDKFKISNDLYFHRDIVKIEQRSAH